MRVVGGLYLISHWSMGHWIGHLLGNLSHPLNCAHVLKVNDRCHSHPLDIFSSCDNGFNILWVCRCRLSTISLYLINGNHVSVIICMLLHDMFQWSYWREVRLWQGHDIEDWAKYIIHSVLQGDWAILNKHGSSLAYCPLYTRGKGKEWRWFRRSPFPYLHYFPSGRIFFHRQHEAIRGRTDRLLVSGAFYRVSSSVH